MLQKKPKTKKKQTKKLGPVFKLLTLEQPQSSLVDECDNGHNGKLPQVIHAKE